ncbi:DUF4395 domain-containing protein [Paenibacillus sp. NEAU-GSW1]|uniref:DUF4395 domain-containing protein n=1 Tax=Paenibacillus sp. NEAU-GSW1 TaxID=2682486 RepID=UPI0012E28A68|nr:DUF4395 domain-containing protein [Paenibacillus sp. NEAU-GSW1]MUT64562.1 DUF4395 family protein [Paenibacillus sp. NEAU-GSW1]
MVQNETAVPSVPMPLVRFNTWVTLAFVVLSWVTQQAWILTVPVLYNGLGAAVGWNPLIVLAKRFFHKPPSSYVSEEKAQLRFNLTLNASMLAAALISGIAGWSAAYYIFTIMPVLAMSVMLAGFCIGCFIRYRWIQYRHARSKAKSA